jgi:elongation factor Ts
MAISAAEVKKLRDQTGAGMMDCKAALEEANGNFDEATTILRKKGLASAAKKAGRATTEGLIANWISDDSHEGILAEVSCETDFVSATEDFKQLMADVVAAIRKAGDAASIEWLHDPNGPVQPKVQALIAKVGENMAVPRFTRYAGQGYIGQYIHTGGKIGVMIELTGVTPEVAAKDGFSALVKELAMQVAAASPLYASRAGVPGDVLDKERAIYRAQMENSGKPANVIDKIVEGKLGSYYSQVVLPDQASIRDPKMSVNDVIAAANKALGTNIVVTRFTRLKVGEGVTS